MRYLTGMIFRFKNHFCLLVAALIFCLANSAWAIPPRPQKSEEELSLGLQVAKHMISMRDARPTPSLGYLLSSRMVRKQQPTSGKNIAVNASMQVKRKRAKNGKSQNPSEI